MVILLTIVHVLVSFFLIGVVLLQTGKRADLAGAFGGGGSQTAFGARGAATLLSKATTVAAVLFFVTSFGLSLLASRPGREGSVLEKAPAQEAPAPVPPSKAP
jgi:preprotein translocase subunit SecG